MVRLEGPAQTFTKTTQAAWAAERAAGAPVYSEGGSYFVTNGVITNAYIQPVRPPAIYWDCVTMTTGTTNQTNLAGVSVNVPILIESNQHISILYNTLNGGYTNKVWLFDAGAPVIPEKAFELGDYRWPATWTNLNEVASNRWPSAVNIFDNGGVQFTSAEWAAYQAGDPQHFDSRLFDIIPYFVDQDQPLSVEKIWNASGSLYNNFVSGVTQTAGTWGGGWGARPDTWTDGDWTELFFNFDGSNPSARDVYDASPPYNLSSCDDLGSGYTDTILLGDNGEVCLGCEAWYDEGTWVNYTNGVNFLTISNLWEKLSLPTITLTNSLTASSNCTPGWVIGEANAYSTTTLHTNISTTTYYTFTEVIPDDAPEPIILGQWVITPIARTSNTVTAAWRPAGPSEYLDETQIAPIDWDNVQILIQEGINPGLSIAAAFSGEVYQVAFTNGIHETGLTNIQFSGSGGAGYYPLDRCILGIWEQDFIINETNTYSLIGGELPSNSPVGYSITILQTNSYTRYGSGPNSRNTFRSLWERYQVLKELEWTARTAAETITYGGETATGLELEVVTAVHDYTYTKDFSDSISKTIYVPDLDDPDCDPADFTNTGFTNEFGNQAGPFALSGFTAMATGSTPTLSTNKTTQINYYAYGDYLGEIITHEEQRDLLGPWYISEEGCLYGTKTTQDYSIYEETIDFNSSAPVTATLTLPWLSSNLACNIEVYAEVIAGLYPGTYVGVGSQKPYDITGGAPAYYYEAEAAVTNITTTTSGTDCAAFYGWATSGNRVTMDAESVWGKVTNTYDGATTTAGALALLIGNESWYIDLSSESEDFYVDWKPKLSEVVAYTKPAEDPNTSVSLTALIPTGYPLNVVSDESASGTATTDCAGPDQSSDIVITDTRAKKEEVVERYNFNIKLRFAIIKWDGNYGRANN